MAEDQVFSSKGIAQMLIQRGFDVTVAQDGETASALATAKHFDLLICDLRLPGISGVDLMRNIRESYPIPGISLGGLGMVDDLKPSTEAGFKEHLIKPVEIYQLVDAVNRAMR